MEQSSQPAFSSHQVVGRPAGLVELPLSTQQRRWWSIVADNPGALSPLVYLGYRMRGRLAVDAWLRAVAAVVDRHEILRARFVERADGPVQVFDPPKGLDVERVDLRDLPEAEREHRARDLLNERRQRPFDLTVGPLLHSCLVRLADEDHIWTLTIHHILADGASLTVIDREIGQLYRAFVEGTEATLPELPIQYGDYAVWCRSVPDRLHDEDRVYWVTLLAGAPALALPTDRPRPGETGAPAGEIAHPLDAGLAAELEALGKASRSTLFMVLLAALHAQLSRRSGQVDFCVGIPVVGARSQPELATMVGVFNNTLALRCDLSGDPTFREIMDRMRDVVLDALDHQTIPFSRVMAELRANHGLDRAPLYEVMFIFEHAEQVGPDLPGLRLSEFPLDVPRIRLDLMVYGWPTGDGIATRFVYNSALFTQTTMTGMAQGFADLLRAVADDVELRLSELPV